MAVSLPDPPLPSSSVSTLVPLVVGHACMLKPVTVNLLWLPGEPSRPNVTGLVIVAFEEGVLEASALSRADLVWRSQTGSFKLET